MRTAVAALLLTAAAGAIAELPEGYWTIDESQPILDATLRVSLPAETAALTDAERAALPHLLDAGRVMHRLYLDQRHPDALASLDALNALHENGVDPAATQNLLTLYYQAKGPIVTTLTNQRLAFVPAGAEPAGKNVYPVDATREEIEAFIAASPETNLLETRTRVRRVSDTAIANDLARLDRFPAIEALHPGLRTRLDNIDAASGGFYAVPYALAYADELAEVRISLDRAASILADESPDFAAYLRHRSRDLLASNYEAGDASWVTGRFDNLNLQIGSYETYDDSLFGVKAFYSGSLLARDPEKSAALAAAIKDLQAIENSLPYEHPQTVRSDIPVGVYNVLADFGQARGANTATILPNEANHTRKYGRTILIRNNILTNPAIFERRLARFRAAVAAQHVDDLSVEGGFNRTLWHEIGHYLGVRETADGQPLSAALADRADLIEEMKADLVSLYVTPALVESGYFDEAARKAHLADGIRRTLQVVRPRPTQPYQNMQLMQFNFFMENGLIELDPESGRLTVHYDRYHPVVSDLLRRVLNVQYAGDYELAEAFITRWNYWDERLHGALAERMRLSATTRYTRVEYEILGDSAEP